MLLKIFVVANYLALHFLKGSNCSREEGLETDKKELLPFDGESRKEGKEETDRNEQQWKHHAGTVTNGINNSLGIRFPSRLPELTL